MRKSITCYDEFIDSFKKDPLETLNMLNRGRRRSNRKISDAVLKLLDDKVRNGGTFRELYELICIETDENIVSLLNSWLTLRDIIDEHKGVFPYKDRSWQLHTATDAYFTLDESCAFGVDVPSYVLSKFFKVNNNNIYQLTLQHDGIDYPATIQCSSNGQGFLRWGNDLRKLIFKKFIDYFGGVKDTNQKSIIHYKPRGRLMWGSHYRKIDIHFYLDYIEIDVTEIDEEGVEVPQVVIGTFFGVENYLQKKDEVSLTFRNEQISKSSYICMIKKTETNYFLFLGSAFQEMLKEQLVKNERKQALHLRWELSGAVFTYFFELREWNNQVINIHNFHCVNESNYVLSNDVSTIESIATKHLEVVPPLKNDSLCELDPNHLTFISARTNQNFVELHHLIPMKMQGEFTYNLDVPANIISLCPNCHRAIHHATIAEKKRLLKSLHEERKNRLIVYGLDISIEGLFSAYGGTI